MPTPYASVGGVDGDLRQHAADVRSARLPLAPTAEGVTFHLDVDASGALLGVTGADGALDSAVPGFWAGPVVSVVCRDLLPDREDFWRSRLVAEVPGAEPTTLVTGLVDLAHAGPGAYRRGRTTRLRLALAAERVQPGDGPPALSCPPEQAVAEVTGLVRTADRRTSTRTGRSFAVLTLETAGGVALDVCAAPEVLPDLPAPGATVTAVGPLTAVFAGTIGELAPEFSPDVEPPLVVTARPAVVPRAPVPLYVPGNVPDQPATTPLVELAGSQVLAPLVHTAGATDTGVIACCADWDGRWQLRRFPRGAVVPDAVVDLAGAPQQCVVHRDGVTVLVGRELLVLDAGLQVLHRATFPPEGALFLVASPAAVHVLVTELADPDDAPDEAGRRAAAQGATVHRYRLHRLEPARLGDPTGSPWQQTDLPVSGVYAPTPTEAPGWVEPTPADTAGEGFWFAVPGRDARDRPAQHHLTVTADGGLELRTDAGGPPWTTACLRHDGLLLAGDTAGPGVDGKRVAQPAPVVTRLLPAAVPAAVVTRLDGQGTVLFELRAGGWTQIAAAPGPVQGSTVADPRTGARWYGLSGGGHPAVLGVVTGEDLLHPVLQVREPVSLVAVADDAAVLAASAPGLPVLDLRDGRLAAAQSVPAGAQRPLTSLVQVGTTP